MEIEELITGLFLIGIVTVFVMIVVSAYQMKDPFDDPWEGP